MYRDALLVADKMDVDVCRVASTHEIALIIAILRIADEDVSIIIVGIEPVVLVALDAHRGQESCTIVSCARDGIRPIVPLYGLGRGKPAGSFALKSNVEEEAIAVVQVGIQGLSMLHDEASTIRCRSPR